MIHWYIDRKLSLSSGYRNLKKKTITVESVLCSEDTACVSPRKFLQRIVRFSQQHFGFLHWCVEFLQRYNWKLLRCILKKNVPVKSFAFKLKFKSKFLILIFHFHLFHLILHGCKLKFIVNFILLLQAN